MGDISTLQRHVLRLCESGGSGIAYGVRSTKRHLPVIAGRRLALPLERAWRITDAHAHVHCMGRNRHMTEVGDRVRCLYMAWHGVSVEGHWRRDFASS